MRKYVIRSEQTNELPISILVFLSLVWFTFGIFIKAPYSGFYFNPANGRILQIYIENDAKAALQPGDVIKKIGSISWEQFKENRKLVFFEDAQAGQTIEVIVERNGQQFAIPWIYPGFTPQEFTSRLINIWVLAYAFWFCGFTVQLFIRPKILTWKLFIAANYLTGIWLILGSLSAWQLWGSSILLHSVTWLLLPVYLHLHWVFPHPLGNMPKVIWMGIYGLGLLFAAGELIQILPHSFYALAFLLALLGSLILEAVHFIKQKDQRRNIVILIIFILIAFAPSISFGLVVANGGLPTYGPLTFFSLPFMPLAYFYVIYRRQLGGLEVRVNRIVSIYAFLILLGTVLILLVMTVMQQPIAHEIWIFIALAISLVTALIAIVFFPAFQAFVEQRILGIKLPYQNLQETYSTSITASTSFPQLLQLLNDEIFPSLLVRQFAFMHTTTSGLSPLLIKNVTANQLPNETNINELASQAGKYIPIFSSGDEWIRLILPLKVGNTFIGFWLLGRRDPDDLYPQAEIPILQSLANQTAIALSNVLQTERLHKLYEDDIERNEKSRLQLALNLHDSVLNQLAVLRLNVDDTHISPNFQVAYDEVSRRLREIVTDLRPPMLSYGLKPAIEELADNLMERSKDTVNIETDLQIDGEVRYAENIEQHLYRIVQEACENALRHAGAANIKISGLLNPQKIILKIDNDGTGFEIGQRLELDTLLANNHFGLAGIVERIRLIDGAVNIRSTPHTGTTIQITWNYNPENNNPIQLLRY